MTPPKYSEEWGVKKCCDECAPEYRDGKPFCGCHCHREEEEESNDR